MPRSPRAPKKTPPDERPAMTPPLRRGPTSPPSEVVQTKNLNGHYTALVRAGQGLKKKSNESWAAGQRCVNVNARYEPEALWHEARCSIVNVVVNVNDNENEKKKKKRSRDPRARWDKTFVVVLLFCLLISTSRRVNSEKCT